MLTEPIRSTPLASAPDAALMFPTLTSAQIARIASHGVTRPITRGEVLIEGGQTDVPFFVLKTGEIEVIRPSGLGDLLIAIVGPAQFTGDISMILGRPAQMRLSVRNPGEVVQLTRDQMHALIQTDAEWKAKGAEFVTPPIDRGAEIRCYMRDPDGYLIEVGQSTGLLRGQRAAKRPEDLPG